MQQAIERAARTNHEVLASTTLAVALVDPLRVMSAVERLGLGQCIFWARPSEQRALVGTGVATAIETTGPSSVATAATAWREIQQHAVVSRPEASVPVHTSGPVLVGGFAFDPLNAATDLWQDFPDGLLVLSHLLFHCDEQCAGLTINVMLRADSDCEQLANAVEEQLERLSTLVLQTPVQLDTASEQSDDLLVEDLLSPARWMDQVAAAVQTIRGGAFEKVVLARSVQCTSPEQPFSPVSTLQRLRENYPDAYVFAIQRGERYFMGATPERLVCSADGQVQTMALAGSAPRGASAEEDLRLGIELLHSAKNQGEHHFVVSTIRQALASLCSRVWVADAPRLLKLRNIQHLQTPIAGDLLPGHSILEAIDILHPTPAVGGYPRLPALAFIREHEGLDRGWYAGPIGWIGAEGNGEFAVALRSALVDGKQATLFAGCGIVADSVPESEYAESCLKLQVMLRGLGGEERTH